MTSIQIRINSAPTPILPGLIDYLLHDYESADTPRVAFAPDGFLPRTYRDKANPSLPETTKYNSHTFAMTVDWCQLDFDLIGHFAPAHILTDPPKGILREEDLKGYVVKSRHEEIYLRQNHGQLFKTNNTGWNDKGFYDPLTGAGDKSGKPYRREDLTTCGNIVWSVGGNKAWAIDALKPAPLASQIWNMPWFTHAATACYGRVPEDWPLLNPPPDDCLDKTSTSEHPNGIWRVTPFGDLEGNTVPIVFLSANPNMPTMDWNGLHLRQIQLEASRVKRVSEIPSPYQR